MAKTTPKPPTANSSGKVEIKFNGEPGHKLVIGPVEIDGGKTGLVDADMAKTLIGSPWANVTLADKSAPTWPDSDEALAALAAQLGVELPAVNHGGGMKTPTLDDKIAALEAAGYTPQSAAANAAAETGSSDTPQTRSNA